jgi:hypothetical protein
VGKRNHFIVDSNDRIKVDITAVDYSGRRSSLIFPQHLKFNPTDGIWTTNGYFTFIYGVPGARAQYCRYPVAARFVGLPGVVAGVTELLVPDAVLVPFILDAVTVKV